MIATKEDMRYYIHEDMVANLGKFDIGFIEKIKYQIFEYEPYKVIKYLRALRYHEFYYNICKDNNSKFFDKLLLRYYTVRHEHLGSKYGIRIGINMIGYGVYIPHVNGNIIVHCRGVGNYCKLNVDVVIGQNKSFDNSPIIGHNVDVCLGSKIVRKVNIGDNVIIAPNSVVIEDVPDNCLVSGVPAKIVKRLVDNN